MVDGIKGPSLGNIFSVTAPLQIILHALLLPLCRLLPCSVETDQTAGGTSKTEDTVVELGVAKGGAWKCEIAQI